MKKLLFTSIIMLYLSLPVILQAYYCPESGTNNQISPSNRIILKLREDIQISPVFEDNVIRSLGLSSLDMIGDKYLINSQDYLFKNPIRENHPEIFGNIFIIEASRTEDVSAIVGEYEKLDMVEYVHPDYQLELYAAPNDPLYDHQWSLHNTGQGFYYVERYSGCGNDTLILMTGNVDADIDAAEVFDNPPDNTRTVIVAIVDTGVDSDHPDLADRIWINNHEIAGNGQDDDHNGYIDDIWGWDFCGDGSMPIYADNDPTDEYGHGTHCAGIVTAITNNNEGIAGILDNCEIMSLKFHPIMLVSFASEAIVYAADNGADVISMSWGYPWPIPMLEEVLAYARSKGVILCAASGNDETEFNNYPASYSTVITVGATNHLDEVTFFSTYGDHLDISAPGRSILSLRADSTDMYASCESDVHIIDTIYYLASGTSMACPHVAGATAYLRAISPGLTPDAAQDILQSTADDIVDPYGTGMNYPGWDKYSGYGRLNLNNALSAAPNLRAKITFPSPNQIISSTFEIEGLADGADFTEYILEYGNSNNPTSWTLINSSGTPVTDGVLGNWNTDTLNGQYTIRLSLDETNVSMVTCHIINSTSAQITGPLQGDTLTNSATITGTAACQDFDYYLLEYGAGSSPSGWHQISKSSVPKTDEELGNWYLGDYPMGYYSIRLTVYSDSGLEALDSVTIYMIPPFTGTNGWRKNLASMVSNTANYGDLNNDGENEIIVGTSNGLKFIDPNGDEITSGMPSAPDYDYTIPFAVGELNGDGVDDLVVIGLYGFSSKLLGFPSSGPSFETDLPFTIDPGNLNVESLENYPYVALRDTDGDGREEIHCYGPVSVGNDKIMECHIYNTDGSFKVQMPVPPDSMQCVYLSADLDGNGTDELYSASGKLYQSDINGVVLDSTEFTQYFPSGCFIRNLCAVEIDQDDKHELIAFVVGRGPADNYLFFAYDENLNLINGWPHYTGIDNFLIPREPIFVDIDRDGSLEYFLLFFELVNAMVYAWHIDGTPVLGDSVSALFALVPNPGKIFTGVVGDFDGDLYPDLVACANSDVFGTYTAERIVAWNRYGQVLDGWPLITKPQGISSQNNRIHTPAIGDIDQDGYIDLVMTTNTNELVFNNFTAIPYNPGAVPVPYWCYNRQQNRVVSILTSVCGDANHDSTVNVSDAVYVINYIFIGGPPPYPYESGNANCDETVNISDAVWILNYIFIGGKDPCDADGDGLPDC